MVTKQRELEERALESATSTASLIDSGNFKRAWSKRNELRESLLKMHEAEMESPTFNLLKRAYTGLDKELRNLATAENEAYQLNKRADEMYNKFSQHLSYTDIIKTMEANE